MVDFCLWGGSEVLSQVREFKYLWVLLMSKGKMVHGFDRQIDWRQKYLIVVKRELSWKTIFEFTSQSTLQPPPLATSFD